MLSFQALFIFTALLLVPVFLAWSNCRKKNGNEFFQMLFGYVCCYFMKSSYTLFDRAINGIEHGAPGIDGLAVFAAIFFLAAAYVCRGEADAGMRYGSSVILTLLVIVTAAVLVECVANIYSIRLLFLLSYLLSFFGIYLCVIVSALKKEG